MNKNGMEQLFPVAFDIPSSKFLLAQNIEIYVLIHPRTSLTDKHHLGSAWFIMDMENKIRPMIRRQIT